MSFDLRSFQHSSLALLVDGIPFEELYDGGGGDISRILIANASKIVVNRGSSSALYGSRGAFGSVNVVTKRPEKVFVDGSVEINHNGGFAVNTALGAPYKNFYFWLAASVIKENSYEISHKLNKNARTEWLNRFIPWYVYGYDPIDTVFTTDGLSYITEHGKWNHTNSIKYYASGKAGYDITKNIEAGVSASYYQGETDVNFFLDSSVSSYNTDNVLEWEDPMDTRMFSNRAWHWPHDYRINVSPYFVLDFDKVFVRGSYFFTKQENILELWTNRLETSMQDRGKISEHSETSNGFYLYPSFTPVKWNRINMVVHYRIEEFIKQKRRLAAFAFGTPSYETPWFKNAEMSAKYLDIAIEDEMNFDTPAGIIKINAGVSYDAQKLSRNKGWREDIADPLLDRPRSNENSILWGTADSFNPVAGILYEPLKNTLKFRGTFSMKSRFPTLHNYSDNADYILEYVNNDPTLLPVALKLNEIKPERSINANGGFEVNIDKYLSIREDYFYSLFKNKIEAVNDANSTVGNEQRIVNIKGRTVQGLESTVATQIDREDLQFVDLSLSLSHVIMFARNNDKYSTVSLGDRVEDTPKHQFILKFSLNTIWDTMLNVWGDYTLDQVRYVQGYAPPSGVTFFTTRYFITRRLHDSVKLNVKLSQKLFDHFDIYVMCRNVLDDYNADPFNPGAGRTWHFGASAEF